MGNFDNATSYAIYLFRFGGEELQDAVEQSASNFSVSVSNLWKVVAAQITNYIDD